ncbi:MAG TPA: tetratricopeptide repeat protein [Sulfuricella sp.]|nr:tetratricopeptide repeat protein [Sulfuricella sp.]
MKTKRLPYLMLMVVALSGAASATQIMPPDFTRALEMGKDAYSGKPAAMDRLKSAAESGTVAAGSVLGALYGIGSPTLRKNGAEAAKWFRKAAEQGDSQARFGLGVMYANGNAVPQDFAAAMKYFHLAAEQGDCAPCFYLGLFYENGLGTAKNYAEAVKWYTRASAAGPAGLRFGMAVGQGKEHPADDNSEVISNFSMVPAQAQVGAEYNLGMLYWNGRGVTADLVGAYKWFILAAAHGNHLANYNLRLLARKMSDAQIASALAQAAAWTREHAPQRTLASR